ncbi:glycoside hydrolase family 9 protein [Olleya sp. Bg11-27]|uniref:glycoside hydrolase family 9 protein n=1 Tax=Olleya sp. Bg11-27 TaxID=2058135 RepID=UPI000C30BAC1|nr:glycoside hydrolase family 9 protein [Olleya sp. Bg11-27]AUC76196.1 endoglucanase [Olleya sp. Bg11-27]
MTKQLLLTLVLLQSFIGLSQVIYSDQFNEGVNNFTSDSSLLSSINNNDLQIVGDGTASAWQNISYSFHNSGSSINVNAASSPKLYIKIKAQNNPQIRLDLIDTNGYVTSLTPSVITPNANYQILEIDYSDKLVDGGYGSSCTSSPCPVDASQLSGMVLFINPGNGEYNGTITIDWLSFGEPLEHIIDYDIRYNQVGYFVGKDKIINIAAPSIFSSKNYTILNANEDIMLSGTTTSPFFWADSDEYIATIDVTSIDTPGTYTFQTDELDISFHVGTQVYESISEASLKYFYYNRASTSIPATYGGQYARAMGHEDTQVYVHSSAASPSRPTGTLISSAKGWYDAGDYNKYVVNSGISTYTLLAAFEHYEAYFTSKAINIPETGGGLPDILDEIKWNLDWLLTMQEPAGGGVYHKLTGLNFSGIVMPEDYTLDRYVVQKSTAATLNFAAVMAMASRIYSNFETEVPGYSAQLLNAAQNAYTWAESNPNVLFENPSDVTTGQYGSTDNTDEFQWAAVELFITTADVQYKNDINVSAIGNGYPTWQYTDPLALISILFHETVLAPDIDTDTARSTLISYANALKTKVESSVMNITMGQASWDYSWGSNGVAANQILILIRGYEATNEQSYLDAAYTAMDYLLGRNGTGYCYVTGFGEQSALNPHHRISEADAVTAPIPGMLAGGPHTGQQDASNCTNTYPSNSNAASYMDNWCSYTSNEVAINWNAPLAYTLNALNYYQNEIDNTLNVTDFNIERENIRVYPNPTNTGLLRFNTQETVTAISVYDINGKQIFISTTIQNNTINLSTMQHGLYFINFYTPKGVIHKKIIKN